MSLKKYYLIFKYLGASSVFKLFPSQIFSFHYCYIFKSNLSFYREPEFARKPVGTLRKLTETDFIALENELPNYSHDDIKELIIRILFFYSGLHNCYGFFIKGKLAHFQWSIYANENHILETHYYRKYEKVLEREIMMENAYTFPRYRGRGLLSYVTNELLKTAKEEGFKVASAYIKIHKFDPMHEFFRLGFKISKLINDNKLLFFSWRRFNGGKRGVRQTNKKN